MLCYLFEFKFCLFKIKPEWIWGQNFYIKGPIFCKILLLFFKRNEKKYLLTKRVQTLSTLAKLFPFFLPYKNSSSKSIFNSIFPQNVNSNFTIKMLKIWFSIQCPLKLTKCPWGPVEKWKFGNANDRGFEKSSWNRVESGTTAYLKRWWISSISSTISGRGDRTRIQFSGRRTRATRMCLICEALWYPWF